MTKKLYLRHFGMKFPISLHRDHKDFTAMAKRHLRVCKIKLTWIGMFGTTKLYQIYSNGILNGVAWID